MIAISVYQRMYFLVHTLVLGYTFFPSISLSLCISHRLLPLTHVSSDMYSLNVNAVQTYELGRNKLKHRALRQVSSKRWFCWCR